MLYVFFIRNFIESASRGTRCTRFGRHKRTKLVEASASNALTNAVAWIANSTSRNATFRPGEKGVTAAFDRLGDRVRQSGIRSSRSIYLYPKTRRNSRHLFVYTRPT